MKNKNAFLKTFIALPNKELINKGVYGCFILIIFFIPLISCWYYKIISKGTINNSFLITFFIFVIIFAIISFIIKKVIEKRPNLFFLYTSTCFTIFSLYISYIACRVIYKQFNSPQNIILIISSIVLYFIFIFFTFLNIYRKFKTNYISKFKIDPKLRNSFIGLCVILGMLSAKRIEVKPHMWILLLLLAYCVVPTYGGFYKYYLSLKLQE